MHKNNKRQPVLLFASPFEPCKWVTILWDLCPTLWLGIVLFHLVLLSLTKKYVDESYGGWDEVDVDGFSVSLYSEFDWCFGSQNVSASLSRPNSSLFLSKASSSPSRIALIQTKSSKSVW